MFGDDLVLARDVWAHVPEGVRVKNPYQDWDDPDGPVWAVLYAAHPEGDLYQVANWEVLEASELVEYSPRRGEWFEFNLNEPREREFWELLEAGDFYAVYSDTAVSLTADRLDAEAIAGAARECGVSCEALAEALAKVEEGHPCERHYAAGEVSIEGLYALAESLAAGETGPF